MQSIIIWEQKNWKCRNDVSAEKSNMIYTDIHFHNFERRGWYTERVMSFFAPIHLVPPPRGAIPICLSRLWLQTELNDTRYCYQLIKTKKKIRGKNQTSVVLFHKIPTVNSAKCETTARAHDAFCLLTQVWRVNFPFNCLVTLSNYKCGAYTVLLVLKSGWW